MRVEQVIKTLALGVNAFFDLEASIDSAYSPKRRSFNPTERTTNQSAIQSTIGVIGTF